MPESKIFFRFIGSDGTSPVEGIPIKNLEAIPESFLSTMSQPRWKSADDEDSPAPGSSSSNPIDIDMAKAPCSKEWKSELAPWIGETYKCKTQGACVALPCDPPLELTDALQILDYLGLAPKDPQDVDVSECPRIVQIRAGIFLRDMEAMSNARELVIDSFMEDPAREKYFVIADEPSHMNCITKCNYQGSAEVRSIGGSLDWVENKKMRESFLGGLSN